MPPSYEPKNAFAPGSASNFGSPGCHSCVGHGTGVMPGRPSAVVSRVDESAAAAITAANIKALKRTEGSFAVLLDGQRERRNRRARRHDDVLAAVDLITGRRREDRGAGLVRIQLLAGAGV